jgi:hypothetical protein
MCARVCLCELGCLDRNVLVFMLCPFYNKGHFSVVRIATCYGLDGPGMESRSGARFSTPLQTGPEAHPTSYIIGTWSFPGVDRPECGVDHPPPSGAEVNEGVELYFYSSSGSSWPVVERTSALLYHFIIGHCAVKLGF